MGVFTLHSVCCLDLLLCQRPFGTHRLKQAPLFKFRFFHQESLVRLCTCWKYHTVILCLFDARYSCSCVSLLNMTNSVWTETFPVVWGLTHFRSLLDDVSPRYTLRRVQLKYVWAENKPSYCSRASVPIIYTWEVCSLLQARTLLSKRCLDKRNVSNKEFPLPNKNV